MTSPHLTRNRSGVSLKRSFRVPVVVCVSVGWIRSIDTVVGGCYFNVRQTQAVRFRILKLCQAHHPDQDAVVAVNVS